MFAFTYLKDAYISLDTESQIKHNTYTYSYCAVGVGMYRSSHTSAIFNVLIIMSKPELYQVGVFVVLLPSGLGLIMGNRCCFSPSSVLCTWRCRRCTAAYLSVDFGEGGAERGSAKAFSGERHTKAAEEASPRRQLRMPADSIAQKPPLQRRLLQ